MYLGGVRAPESRVGEEGEAEGVAGGVRHAAWVRVAPPGAAQPVRGLLEEDVAHPELAQAHRGADAGRAAAHDHGAHVVATWGRRLT